MAIDFAFDRWATIKDDAHRWWSGELKRPLIQMRLTGRDPGRPAKKLLLDLYDDPDGVKRLSWHTHDMWWTCYDGLNDILQPANPGYTAWTHIYSKAPYYMLQCDFCYMIGPDMFDEFVNALATYQAPYDQQHGAIAR